MLLSHCDEIINNVFLFFKKNQVRRVRISEMITASRNLVTKPQSKILQKQVNGLLFRYKTGLKTRKIYT